jgi:hypothetical protein
MDQLSDLKRDLWSSGARLRFPAPVGSEPRTMPSNHSLCLTTASADRTSGNSRESPTSINRSSALKLSRFGAVRRRTRICWRRTRFSASSVALDRNSPNSSDQITLQPAHIGREHRPIRPRSPTDEIYDRDNDRFREAEPPKNYLKPAR